MTKIKPILSLITLLAAATAVPTLAAADHRPDNRWTQLGEVGTHSHDAEDYIPVSTPERFQRLELRAQGRAVRVDQVVIQFTDGRKFQAHVHGLLRPGQPIVVDVPADSAIKMLVLDYGNRAPYWRAREDARVAVRGLRVAPPERDDRPRGSVRDRRDDRSIRDRRTEDVRFEWRGGFYVRLI